MNGKQFESLVDLHSADLSRWPQETVRPALELMEKDAAARRYFETALAAENTLRAYMPQTANLAGLEEKIMQRIAGLKQPLAPAPSPAFFRPSWLFAPGGGLVAAVIAGFLVGFNPAPQKEYLLDPAFYSAEHIIAGDDALYEEGIF